MNRDKEELRHHTYTIPQFDILSLNEVYIQIHSSETFLTGRDTLNLRPEEIDLDQATFIIHEESEHPVVVSVIVMQKAMQISCTCPSQVTKLCRHQSRVLYNICKRTDLKLFFDKLARQERLRKYAEQFGLENEQDLDKFFELFFENDKAQLRSKIKGLLAVNTDTTDKLQLELMQSADSRKKARMDKEGQLLVVIRQHKYYNYLVIQLARAEFNTVGNIKNPIKILRAVDFLWQSEDVHVSKFFTAIQLFEHGHQEVDQASIEALKIVLKNPLDLAMFRHDPAISDNLNIRSLSKIEQVSTVTDCRISVTKEDLFYKISARVILDDVSTPIEDLRIRYNYFLEYGEKLYLPTNHKILQLISLFRQYDFCISIAESKYQEFRKSFLSKLEDEMEINYSYLKPATPAQLIENDLIEPPAKLIYLTDSNPYVEIEPVMKYGKEEIAVLSRRYIYSTGLKGEVFSVQRDTEAELAFVADIAKQHPFFTEQLEDGLSYFYLHKERFLDENWFLEAFESWREQGIQIFGFNKLNNNLLNPNKAKIQVQVLSGLNWFNVNLEVRYGKKKASLKKIKKAIKNKSRYIELDDGSLGIIPGEWIEKFKSYFETGEIIDDEFQIPRTNFAVIRHLFDSNVLSKDVKAEVEFLQASFADFETIEEVEPPKELQAELRDYQRQGLNWLNFLDNFNFGACLADDMGLGKTIQILALLLIQRQKRDHNVNLVVVPTSLLFNWSTEIEKFAPSLSVYVLYGNNRTYNFQEFLKHEIILTSYGTLLSDIRYIKDFEFNYVILDESQNIKNPESQRYKASRLLRSRNRVALTGTPFENNTYDLYAQLSFACPGLLGSKQYFRDVYSTPIDKFKDARRLLELQNLIKPFILRRTKKQVASELPEKTEMILYCEMKDSQRRVYENYEQEIRDYLSGIDSDDVSKSSIHVLRGLTRLRQICDSPLLLREPTLTDPSSSKIDALLEQIETKSKKHKILVFSQFVSMLDLVKNELEKRQIGYTYLSGASKDRQKEVNKFQEEEEIRVFLISLKAGGTGLNLTKADYVYLLDPWWNPATENQAIDRIYRIGQKKNVVAVRMICPNTVEEKILKLQEGKNDLASRLIHSDSSFFKSLTKEDLIALVSSTIPDSLR
ncbi:DEAD/DEAH box helicase [Desertivirga arenae]|uniref:DEAD/DEAH box helicase n=1 Tax=Desertivirga arenae TaxID=2810309 RepID=UPI001A978475|nr:DEAD/DEAH box helicase [Pedobacter sp. SYSU D00823]